MSEQEGTDAVRRVNGATPAARHVEECEESLRVWAGRRGRDHLGQVIPRQNIQGVLARQNAVMRCLDFMENRLGVDFSSFDVLEVGSGIGKGLIPFLLNEFTAEQLHGIDLFEERVARGKASYPGVDLFVGDATKMTMYPADRFDLTMEQFCFCHVQDDEVVRQMAAEMLRVTKKGGFILVLDWEVGSKRALYNGISRRKIEAIFEVGSETNIVRRFPAQLAPPIGRPLSHHCPSLYPLVAALLPFLVLSRVTLLERIR